MEKLYKLILLFVGLTAMNLTVQAQLSAYTSSFLVDSTNRSTFAFTPNLNQALQSEMNFDEDFDQIITISRSKQATDFTNYPNPATTFTTVGYTLTARANVVLKVIDLAGKQIAVLIKQQQDAGKQEFYWELSKNNITSGMYILILQVDNKTYSRKIIVQ